MKLILVFIVVLKLHNPFVTFKTYFQLGSTLLHRPKSGAWHCRRNAQRVALFLPFIHENRQTLHPIGSQAPPQKTYSQWLLRICWCHILWCPLKSVHCVWQHRPHAPLFKNGKQWFSIIIKACYTDHCGGAKWVKFLSISGLDTIERVMKRLFWRIWRKTWFTQSLNNKVPTQKGNIMTHKAF